MIEDGLVPLVYSSPRGSSSDDEPLPDRMAHLSRYGLYAFLSGCVLMGTAFLINPVPDPSFPWATLPASFRLSYTQPRIEHWPVTYTVGLWSIVFAFPLTILYAYQRWGVDSRFSASDWLVGVPVSAMLALTTYCRFFWPKLHPAAWNAPSYTLVCWAYCSSYIPTWSDLAYVVAFLGVGALYLARQGLPRAKRSLALWGVLSFPLGVPALYEASRR